MGRKIAPPVRIKKEKDKIIENKIYYAEFNILGYVKDVQELTLVRETPKTIYVRLKNDLVARIHKDSLEKGVEYFIGEQCIFKKTKGDMLAALQEHKAKFEERYSDAIDKLLFM